MGSHKGWTVSTLREHFFAILEEKDKAIAEARNVARDAQTKTQEAQDTWNSVHNDLQRQIERERQTLVTRDQLELTLKPLQDQIDLLATGNAFRQGIDRATATVGGVVLVFVSAGLTALVSHGWH